MDDINIITYIQGIGISIELLAEKILERSKTVSKGAAIIFRIKNPNTLQKKMTLKNVASVLSIKDVYGLRLLLDYIEDVYAVIDELKKSYAGHIDHDYIANPKIRVDGEMLRLLIYVSYINGVPFEIQITTKLFNEINEKQHEGYHLRKYHTLK